MTRYAPRCSALIVNQGHIEPHPRQPLSYNPDIDGNHKRQDANARLIAVAPELLGKCEKVVAWLDRLASHAEANAAKNDRFPSLKEAEIADAKNYRASAKDIRAVIAKANQLEN